MFPSIDTWLLLGKCNFNWSEICFWCLNVFQKLMNVLTLARLAFYVRAFVWQINSCVGANDQQEQGG